MADNSKSRRKTFIVSILAFLLLGGGVFLFFIIQGSNDLTKSKNQNFEYGSVVRGSLAPFFKYIGLEEEKPARSVHEGRLARFLEKETENIDMASWLNSNQGDASAPAARARDSRSASARGPAAVIPRMAGGGGGGIAGGGGSKSSGGLSRFEGGSDKGNTRISAAASSDNPGAGRGGGTLGSLRGAQSLLSAGLRSGSAMTARSSGDRSYAGTTGRGAGRGGDLAYGGSGLSKLDTIKGGDISDLKTTDPKAGAAPASSPPKLAEDPEKAKEDLLKDLGDKLVSGAVSKGAGALGGDGGAPTPASDSPVVEPPPGIKKTTEESEYHCKTPCTADEGGMKFMAKDNEVTYQQVGPDWIATFKGEYLAGDQPNSPHYAKYEQSFVVGENGLTPVNRGSCIMPDGSNCPVITPP